MKLEQIFLNKCNIYFGALFGSYLLNKKIGVTIRKKWKRKQIVPNNQQI